MMTLNEILNAYNNRTITTIETLAKIDDATALTITALFPEWSNGIDYTADTRIRYNGKLYRVVQSHTSQADWTPDVTPALYTEVAEPGQGTRDNPIPYSGNMALEKGKYYAQDGVVYICTRDTVNPVYNALADLVGLYVERVTE